MQAETIGTAIVSTPDGFVTGDNLDFLGEVAGALNRGDASLSATLEQVGGGVFGISVPTGTGSYTLFGMSDGILAADVYEGDELLRSVVLPSGELSTVAVTAETVFHFVRGTDAKVEIA